MLWPDKAAKVDLDTLGCLAFERRQQECLDRQLIAAKSWPNANIGDGGPTPAGEQIDSFRDVDAARDELAGIGTYI